LCAIKNLDAEIKRIDTKFSENRKQPSEVGQETTKLLKTAQGELQLKEVITPKIDLKLAYRLTAYVRPDRVTGV